MVGQHIRQYYVIKRLGHGGMATVYQARDETLDRDVAIKILETQDADGQRRFRSEAIALARLDHPGIATIHELFQEGARWMLVMELVRGEALDSLSNRLGPFSPRQAAEICLQILAPLAHAHEMGIVHRDLKPSNVMINETGAVKVMDFGIARVVGDVRLTNVGVALGTPAYMAPEQFHGGDTDVRTDLFALGIMFYQLITGTLPFKGTTAISIAQAQLQNPVTLAQDMRSNPPRWVDDVVATALARDPSARFQSAPEFQRALALGVETDRLPDGTQHEPTEPLRLTAVSDSRRYWSPAALAAGVAVTLGVLVGVPATHGCQLTSRESSPRAKETTPGTGDRGQTTSASAADVDLPLSPKPALGTTSPPPPTESLAVLTFTKARLLTVEGPRATERDVDIAFSATRMIVRPKDQEMPIITLPYRSVVKATYVHARDPQWDESLSRPTEKINVPGILGRSRHWFVAQTRSNFTILRLDQKELQDLLGTFETRTGLKIARPSVKN